MKRAKFTLLVASLTLLFATTPSFAEPRNLKEVAVMLEKSGQIKRDFYTVAIDSHSNTGSINTFDGKLYTVDLLVIVHGHHRHWTNERVSVINKTKKELDRHWVFVNLNNNKVGLNGDSLRYLDFAVWDGITLTKGTLLPSRPEQTIPIAMSVSEIEHSAWASLYAAKLFVGNPEKQREIYRDVIQTYPGARAAMEAEELLALNR